MKNILLPYGWKWVGFFLSLTGIVLAVFYLFFEFSFTLPVFAVFSSFIETKVFTTFRTNFTDELTLLLIVAGFSMIVLSKEKHETEKYDSLRLQSLFKAMLVNTVFMLFSLLFIYGAGFLAVLIFNLVSLQLFYLVFFFFARKYHG